MQWSASCSVTFRLGSWHPGRGQQPYLVGCGQACCLCRYTIEWAGNTGDERLSEDAATVWVLGELLGTPVNYVAGESASDRPPRAGDLFADPAHDLARSISRHASDDGFKVLLSGQGGDELFGGYARHRIAPLLPYLRLGVPARVAEQLLNTYCGGLRAEYLARIARAAAESDLFASYMQICTYSTAVDRARVLGCDEAEVSNEIVWQRHRAVFDSLPPGISFLRKADGVGLGRLPARSRPRLQRPCIDGAWSGSPRAMAGP